MFCFRPDISLLLSHSGNDNMTIGVESSNGQSSVARVREGFSAQIILDEILPNLGKRGFETHFSMTTTESCSKKLKIAVTGGDGTGKTCFFCDLCIKVFGQMLPNAPSSSLGDSLFNSTDT